jgi:TRAP-type C4-dicarboxylate transport system substrate-binding protein
MKQNRVLVLISGICMVLMLVALPFVGACAEPSSPETPAETPVQGEAVNLTMVSMAPMSVYSINYACFKFKKWVEMYSGGRITIDLKGGSEVAAPTDLPQVTEKGIFDISFCAPLYVGAQYPAFQLPIFMYPGNHRVAVHDPEFWDLMSKVGRNHGMVYLGVWMGGLPTMLFLAKEPPLDAEGKIASLEGITVRTGGPADGDLIKCVGGSPVALAPTEQYEALRLGVIDGVLTSVKTAVEYKLWEVTNYVGWDQLCQIHGIAFMNAKKFDSLSAEDQRLIIELCKDELQYASYNYTVACAFDGLHWTPFSRSTFLNFNAGAMQKFTQERDVLFHQFAAAEPNLSDEILRICAKYYSEEQLNIDTQITFGQ